MQQHQAEKDNANAPYQSRSIMLAARAPSLIGLSFGIAGAGVEAYDRP